MQPTALVTGLTGQDGSYLAEFLLGKGYRVVGMHRRTSSPNFQRIEHILDRIEVIEGDLIDQNSLSDILRKVKPTEVYNLAAQSFVPTSWGTANPDRRSHGAWRGAAARGHSLG